MAIPTVVPLVEVQTSEIIAPGPGDEPLVALQGVSYWHGRDTLLHDVNLAIGAGEMVAIAGPSGAGKSTLLRVIAGLLTPGAGRVTYATEISGGANGPSTRVGYVPQDDIVPLELSVRRVLLSAATLVLAKPADELRCIVADVTEAMGLSHRLDTPVHRLSGGERKRVNVAVELLTEPGLFLLDEPTSGLDPAAAGALLGRLRSMSTHGAAVVLTTHSTADIDVCDRVVFVGGGGVVAFVGTPAEARRYFGVTALADVYVQLERIAPPMVPPSTCPRRRSGRRAARPQTSGMRQWWALSARSAAQLLHNRLTLAILIGSPVLVTLMMTTLFPSGGFSPAGGALMGVQESYWISFAVFFFGLTYGLLQIVVELPIVRRDRVRGVRMSAYLAAKVTVLVPILLSVDVFMLVVLRGMDRIPARDTAGWTELGVTIALVSIAALATGLLASAAVGDTTQATLALPMICFPQVLFAGVLVPHAQMTTVGQAIGDALITRWGFESIGRSLGVGNLVRPTDPFSATFTASLGRQWLILAVLAALMLGGALAVLRARTATDR